MYKLLYFSDFDFYELYETKMTGETYKKLQRGPAPDNFDLAIIELEKNKIKKSFINFRVRCINRDILH